MRKPENLHDLLQKIENTIVPVFPVRGKDIIAAGVDNNRKIGKILDRVEQKG